MRFTVRSFARNQFLDLAQLLLAEKHFLADEEGRRAERAALDRRLRVLDQLRLDVGLLRAREQFRRIEEEYHVTRDFICKITGQNRLLDNVPMLQSSIERRNPFVDPLSYIQLVLLQRLRRGEQPADELLTACLESINGIASGLKNTG